MEQASYRNRIEHIWKRWVEIVWYREELRRTLEMVREDDRLRYAQSTFVGDVRNWYANVVGAAAFGELNGTDHSSTRELLEDALCDFAQFRASCAFHEALPDASSVETLLSRLKDSLKSVAQWFAAERLLLDGAKAAPKYDDLDAAVTAMEGIVLDCQRAITGGASSSLLATEQFDWYDVFTLPWQPREEAEMPSFSAAPPSTTEREVAIFPWLELREPITALGITLLPRDRALDAVGADEPALRSRTNYFYDEHRRRLKPVVALLPEGDLTGSKATVARAAHALLFASSALNAPGGVSYANATLLEYFFQRLGGTPEFVARRVRRRYGSRVGGSHTGLLRAQRPDWAGSDLRFDAELIEALARVAMEAEEGAIFESLRWYYIASTDADSIPPDIDRVHLRTAVERLLREPEDERSPRTGEQIKRVGALTSRFVTWQCDVINGEVRNHHQQALWVLIEDRNVSVHGASATRPPYPFELTDTPPDWIFDRLFVSLLVAALIERKALTDSPRWRGFIEAFEFWLAGAAGTFNEIWSGRSLTMSFRAYDVDPRPPLPIRADWLDSAFVYVRKPSEPGSP